MAIENTEDDKKEEFKETPLSRSIPSDQKFSFSKILKRRSKSKSDVKLTIENDENIEMTHKDIAHWIDTKARWIFPLFFFGFVLFYFISIEFEIMDQIMKYF